ncbi:nucleotidyltransferase family protein [Diplocloster hominis]|uniref:nucleotidyltransferase family protein n=1 Tax=Diplocloster hominis TaxID=3079010 RepID=UPI0031BA205A
MDKPVLVIMAAGMGSRYGGLKQIDPVDREGHIIMDFSVYDAVRAGFKKVIFIIKRENEEVFREVIGNRLEEYVEVEYAFQELADLPAGYQVPEGRVKPWGTAHAVFSCRDLIQGPFAVINADDYYGPKAFQMVYDFLVSHQDGQKDTLRSSFAATPPEGHALRDAVKYNYAMVGYVLENTLTENGSVARGVCEVSGEGHLVSVTERTKIQKIDGQTAYSEDNGATWRPLPADSTVSMNLWGFTESFLDEIRNGFEDFLREGLSDNPLKCEYFLPAVVTRLLQEEKALVTVLRSDDKWYGVTYKEDKEMVEQAIQSFKDQGRYPRNLWTER